MKVIFTVLGLVCVAIGAIGVFVIVLPTVPFLLLAALLLARGSEKFNNWFINTKLYKNNLEDFVKTRGMTASQKAKILAAASVMLLAAFFICPSNIGKAVIVGVIIVKYYVFLVRIKTIKTVKE